ncbi:MAG: hypothetical protein C0469_14950 [Cyanobacteria bacterium DS2.3.42]|nr:hypothetical protein [Cyanobacteria bacterium DS2.3.42]
MKKAKRVMSESKTVSESSSLGLSDASLKILACDINSRAQKAPGISDLMPFFRQMEQDTNALIIWFDSAGQDVVQAFADAERNCCQQLSWKLESKNEMIRLIVSGTPEQVQTLKEWFV